MSPGVSTVCAWCGRILVDADHARTHVVRDCGKAPWAALELDRMILLAAIHEAMNADSEPEACAILEEALTRVRKH